MWEVAANSYRQDEKVIKSQQEKNRVLNINVNMKEIYFMTK